MSTKPIYVTQPSLPPLAEFVPYLEQIWDNKQLTNCGPFHDRLEAELARYMGIPYISLFANGTLALVTALQALEIKGEVITTPFSFVATTHALKWNGIDPVFVDIDPETFNLDPEEIEAAITPRTTAILPVHCYGHDCDIERIEQIAQRHGLKVIYDAAHAFGVTRNGKHLAAAGDVSMLSFHATKVFNTFEGGALVCHDSALKARIDYLKNFGIRDEVTVLEAGINGKMNEFQAAFGLLQLGYVEQNIRLRSIIARRYREALEGVRGIRHLSHPAGGEANHAYFPILVGPDYPLHRDALYELLKTHGIVARRYFYPLISNLPMYAELSSADPVRLPVANEIASQVLCLPIYPALDLAMVDKIISIIQSPGITVPS
ncbi:MAG: DegT/DnrJ/EryC1/StrS family aminotransferase [Burkholderiales bacterium]|nr:DegT/DnrJ/EryC1/StrS family aminotransferase [Burkholderiales bacterium]